MSPASDDHPGFFIPETQEEWAAFDALDAPMRPLSNEELITIAEAALSDPRLERTDAMPLSFPVTPERPPARRRSRLKGGLKTFAALALLTSLGSAAMTFALQRRVDRESAEAPAAAAKTPLSKETFRLQLSGRDIRHSNAVERLTTRVWVGERRDDPLILCEGHPADRVDLDQLLERGGTHDLHVEVTVTPRLTKDATAKPPVNRIADERGWRSWRVSIELYSFGLEKKSGRMLRAYDFSSGTEDYEVLTGLDEPLEGSLRPRVYHRTFRIGPGLLSR